MSTCLPRMQLNFGLTYLISQVPKLEHQQNVGRCPFESATPCSTTDHVTVICEQHELTSAVSLLHHLLAVSFNNQFCDWVLFNSEICLRKEAVEHKKLGYTELLQKRMTLGCKSTMAPFPLFFLFLSQGKSGFLLLLLPRRWWCVEWQSQLTVVLRVTISPLQ